ncbi:hypothetical protein RhiLY_10448 [Ceratobasidium sp. AG-Ba]|nr:hypothetical protein RhiLY_10448 [Ceratobasidium sp. AG-Ba]
MRKTPYLISLAVALIALTLTIVSIALPKWLIVPSPNGSEDLSYTGLYERCELRPTSPTRPYPDPSPLPDPTLPPPRSPNSDPNPPEPQSYSDVVAQLYHQVPPPITDPSNPSNPTLPPPTKSPKKHHRDDHGPRYKCRPFPTRSMCDRDGQTFCIVWSSAGYAMQMSVVFAVITLIALGIVSFRFSTRARRRGAWKLVGALTALQVALQIAAMAMIVHLRRTYPGWFSSNTKYGPSFILLIVSWSISTLLAIGLVGTGFAARAGHKWAAGKRGYHPIPDAH